MELGGLMRGRCCRVHSSILEAKKGLPFPKNKKGLTIPTLSLRKLSKMRDNRGARDLRLWSFPLSQHLVCYSYVPRPPASSTGQRHRLSVRDRLPSLFRFSFALSAAANPTFPSSSSFLRFLLFLSSLARLSRSRPSAFRRARFSSSSLTTHGSSSTSFWNAVFSAQAAASSFVVRMMAVRV